MPHTAAAIGSMLVVDDSVVQRQHAATLCRELGIPLIYEARDGHEALDLLAMLVLPPGLMLIDLEMPGMDGVELIQQLQQRQIDVPFIVASSREAVLIGAVETMAASLGLRVVAGLQKPLDLAALRHAVGLAPQPGTRRNGPRGPAIPVEPAVLARAIADGELSVHYQPKVDVQTGRVHGVEALARWQHPTLGWIPPDNFVPLAERCDQIHALTLAVTSQALAQAAAWRARGLQFSVAINLSPRLLDRPSLLQDIDTLTAQHGLPAEQVVFEITESTVATQLGTALGTLTRLRLKGYGLSIDDYGTGFSSMQQLARIPFTELKVDRSFVHGAHRRKHLRVILQSALHMARQLELVTVAEGIETVEDWRLLQESGCDIAQGYLLARPMPADAMLPWLKTHRTRLLALRGAAQAAASPTEHFGTCTP